MVEIKEWLNGSQNYDTGCDLIIKHHPNKALHQVFREAATPYKVQRLKKELLALLQTASAPPVPKVVTPQCPHKHGADVAHLCSDCNPPTVVERIRQDAQPSNRWGAPEAMPPVVHALWLQWKPIYLERNNIMARLHDVAKAGLTDAAQKEEAGRMAHRILDLDEQIERIYADRQHYILHRELPVATQQVDDLVVDPKKIPQALANAQRYVREYKRRVKDAPANAGFAAKLDHWQKRVDHYQTILNA